MASAVLTLPSRGNFRVRSRCRRKTQAEIQRGICHQWNSVLQIQAVIKLPKIGQYEWRNQCFNNRLTCKHAAEIWRELNHKNLAFYAECGVFKRNMWNFSDRTMERKGLFKCVGSNPIELRVRAKRVR